MANRIVFSSKDCISSPSLSTGPKGPPTSPLLLPLKEEYELEKIQMRYPLRYPKVRKTKLPPLPDNVRKIRDGLYVTYHDHKKSPKKDDSTHARPERVQATVPEEEQTQKRQFEEQ